jgi:hypothetical protein
MDTTLGQMRETTTSRKTLKLGYESSAGWSRYEDEFAVDQGRRGGVGTVVLQK